LVHILSITFFKHTLQNRSMFFIQLSNVLSLLLLSHDVLFSFLLPNLSLDLISPLLFLLSESFVLNLLEEIVLGGDFLGVETISSTFLIIKFSSFSGKVLCKNPFVLFFLFVFVVFDDSFSHHVHELSLSFFSVGHFISSLLLLGFNQSGVLLLGFDILESLLLFLLLLLKLIPLIILKHFSKAHSLFFLSVEGLLLLFDEFFLDLSDHSLIEVFFLLEFVSLSLVLIVELFISGELLSHDFISHFLSFCCLSFIISLHLLKLEFKVSSIFLLISFLKSLLLHNLSLEIRTHLLLLFSESQLLHLLLFSVKLGIEFHDGGPLILFVSS